MLEEVPARVELKELERGARAVVEGPRETRLDVRVAELAGEPCTRGRCEFVGEREGEGWVRHGLSYRAGVGGRWD